MFPEEKMAAKVLLKRGLTPPYDLDALAREYGDLEYRAFPFEADGITVGIAKQARPKILINRKMPDTRRKFTLAHEIGHIVIPWHTGTVISHIDPTDSDLDYKAMELEANKFAAELLMPSSWLLSQYEESRTVEEYFRKVLLLSGASKDAAYYKIFKYLSAPVICARLNGGVISGVAKSLTAPASPSLGSYPLGLFGGFDFEQESFSVDGISYLVWSFAGRDIREVDARSWRDILQQILSDVGLEAKSQSINAILATAFQSNKSSSEEVISGAIIRSFSGRESLEKFSHHPLFEQYVIKRVKELKLR